VLPPVSAAAVGVLFLDETLNSLQLAAFAIALAGVALATLPQQSSA
jgi:drug/metabolite transporter (DMT)-like permease